MPIGAQTSIDTVNFTLTRLAVGLRDQCLAMLNFGEFINDLGLTGLGALGYGTAGNPSNPGGISDAQYVLNLVGYMTTVAQVEQGLAAQTPAFDFDNALSVLWAGQ